MENQTGRIIIVDDRGTIRSTVQAVLEDCGYEVIALEAVSETHLLPALEAGVVAVITDLVMPGWLSGIEVAMFLRDHKFRGRVIMITACQDPELRFVAKTVKIDEILGKPFGIDALTGAVTGALA